jgi:beta-lactamase regulating signal transducer with metallopeptidase domain
MWVWLDCVGSVLFDAALSTVIFLSFVVLAMLGCRQPSRRILIARASLIASLLMVPIVAFAPLPRIDVVDAAIHSHLLPAHFLPAWQHKIPDQLSEQPSASAGSAAIPVANRRHTALGDAHPWVFRGLTLIDLACVTIGSAWLALGFWGVCWLLRHSREPSPKAIELYDRLFSDGASNRARPALRVTTRVEHPVVVGLIHPTILIPPGYDEP